MMSETGVKTSGDRTTTKLSRSAPTFVPALTVAIPKIPFVPPFDGSTVGAKEAAEKLELGRIEQFLQRTFGEPLEPSSTPSAASPLVYISLQIQGEKRDSVRVTLTFNDARACDRALRELDETPFPIPQGFPFRNSTFHVWRLRVRRIVSANEQSDFWRPSRLVTVGGIPDERVGALVLHAFRTLCVHGILSSRLERDPLLEDEDEEEKVNPVEGDGHQHHHRAPKDRYMTLQVLLRTIDDLAAVMKHLQGYPVQVPGGFWCHGNMTKSYRFVIHVVFVTNDKKRWADLDDASPRAPRSSEHQKKEGPLVERRHGPLWESRTVVLTGLHLLSASELLRRSTAMGPKKIVPSPLHFESTAALSTFVEAFLIQLLSSAPNSSMASCQDLIDSMTILRSSTSNTNLTDKSLSLFENLAKMTNAPRSICTLPSASSQRQVVPSTSDEDEGKTVTHESRSSRGIPEDIDLPTSIPLSSNPVLVLIQMRTTDLAAGLEQKMNLLKKVNTTTSSHLSSSALSFCLRSLTLKRTSVVEAEAEDPDTLLDEASAYHPNPSSGTTTAGCKANSNYPATIVPPPSQLLGYDLVKTQ